MTAVRELAKVKSARIVRTDRGLLTLEIALDYGGSAQCFCPIISEYDERFGRQVGCAHGLDIVVQVMELFNVDRIEQIAGRTVYALLDRPGGGGIVVGLELPPFDGGGSFTIAKWREDWGLR